MDGRTEFNEGDVIVVLVVRWCVARVGDVAHRVGYFATGRICIETTVSDLSVPRRRSRLVPGILAIQNAVRCSKHPFLADQIPNTASPLATQFFDLCHPSIRARCPMSANNPPPPIPQRTLL